MSKRFVVGKQYKLAEGCDLDAVLCGGKLTLPDVFTCTFVDSLGECHSTDAGVLWRGETKLEWDDEGWAVGTAEELTDGTFEEVTASAD